ncbi:hypothetical protein M6B38_293945 [Iris pallida]|uniref:Uncharacterized protein n=1 Tax=Iris pallida TaxID=29817 RepID=A0AAX6HUP2_IRIPA|nr:hypothetical protein M6B38_293945 [Iris pallida]
MMYELDCNPDTCRKCALNRKLAVLQVDRNDHFCCSCTVKLY